MSTVNPNLDTIIEKLDLHAADELTALGTIATKQDENFARLDFMAGQVETTTGYVGDIRADMVGVHEKLDTGNGLLQQVVDLLTNIRDTLDIMNNNNAANAQQVFINWDLLLANNAANAETLRAAICGDCTTPTPPAIEDGASCRISTRGSTGSTTTVTFDVTYFIGPGVEAGVGDTVRYRINSCTRTPTSITLYEGPVETGTSHVITIAGAYVEYTLTDYPSSLVFVFPSTGAFNFNQTVCLVGTPG